MRHIPISEPELQRLVQADHPGWTVRADARARALSHQGHYAEKAAIWSEIKPVFMRLQHNKCAYCERKLAGGDRGTIEHDLEHFRPKNRVDAWPTPAMTARGLTYRFATGGRTAKGYYSLAYSLLNYATACKPCNTMLKACHFPIAGKRCQRRSRRVSDYASERPLLIYPLGDVDVPPETLLTFDGVVPIPKASRGHRRHRALITIDFFELDRRQDLLEDRARLLALLYLARKAGPSGAPYRRTLCSPQSPHSTCVQAYDALYTLDHAKAKRIFEQAKHYLPG